MDLSTIILVVGITIIFVRSKKFYTWICLKFKLNTLKKVKYNAKEHDPQSTKIDGNGECYPNCDNTVWLRSCIKEIIEPIDGHIIGNIPTWLNGSLLRNGPGTWKVDDMMFQHLFDCSALLHRFSVKDCHVTYQNRFIQTETLKKNTDAKKIVVTEFGTAAIPNACHSIFDKVSAIFRSDGGSDNTLMSIYPIGDEYYAFTETPFIYKINLQTLATEKRVCLNDYIDIATHTAHPHVTSNGTIFNLSMSTKRTGPVYNIMCFPYGDNMFDGVQIIASIPCRWKLSPCYIHSFGITDNYFIIVEQPFSISLMEYVKAQLCNQNLAGTFKWSDNKPVIFYLVERQTGKLSYTYQSDAFFFFHIINQYEDDNHVVIDICCYQDPAIINCMYLESMMNMQSDPNYATLIRCRPLRFVLPLHASVNKQANLDSVKVNGHKKLLKSITLAGISNRKEENFHTSNTTRLTTTAKKLVNSLSHVNNLTSTSSIIKDDVPNLVNLTYTTAEAYDMRNGSIFVKPQLLCDVACETPQIYYERYSGKPYRYFYASSYDVNAKPPGALIKVDVFTNTFKQWHEVNCYPSEPIFVSSPDSKDEDDGIILSALVWGGFNENKVGLLILCAKTWIEKARCIFHTPGPVPKCLHGWFVRDVT